VSTPLPLAAAAVRLRPPLGRPRKASPASTASEHDAARRLLDLAATASYLAVSVWTVRDLEAAGTLKRVHIPLRNGGALRKLLFDIQDLDALIGQWKDGSGR
jgi:hypothetical protein